MTWHIYRWRSYRDIRTPHTQMTLWGREEISLHAGLDMPLAFIITILVISSSLLLPFLFIIWLHPPLLRHWAIILFYRERFAALRRQRSRLLLPEQSDARCQKAPLKFVFQERKSARRESKKSFSLVFLYYMRERASLPLAASAAARGEQRR